MIGYHDKKQKVLETIAYALAIAAFTAILMLPMTA